MKGKILSVIITLSLMVGVGSATSVSAAPIADQTQTEGQYAIKMSTLSKKSLTKSERRALYRKFVSKKQYYSDIETEIDGYIIFDLNGDGVEELMIRGYVCADYLYTCINGKVKYMGEMIHPAFGSGSFCRANGVAVIDECYYRTMDYYVFNGKSLKLVAEESFGKFYIKGKEVSYKKYDKYVKRITNNGKKMKQLDDLKWKALSN